MSIEVERKCQDYGEEGCLGTPDPSFTMCFDDIGEGSIFWCSHCGARANVLKKWLEGWINNENRTQEEMLKLKASIEAAELETAAEKN
jgi:hypothetical protein